MRKKCLYLLIAVLVLVMCACTGDQKVAQMENAPTESVPTTADTVAGNSLASSEGVVKITISSLPESDTYRRTYTSTEKIRAVIDYIDGLTLTDHFPENPNVYTGMIWVVTYYYEDGTELPMYHFGNMFFRTESEDWYRMVYEEAAAFSTVVYENPSD